MDFVIYAVGLACIGATTVPLSKHEVWWVRACDFPRAQIVVVAVATVAALVITQDLSRGANQLLLAALIAVLAYQLILILPYTPLRPKQLLDSSAPPGDRSLRLLVVNVLMTNRRSDRLFDLIEAHQPDLILALETDAWWCARFEKLASAYPHRLTHPLENTYGVLLYSRLELFQPEIRFLLKPEIPSIRAGVRLRSDHRATLYGLHPEPPSPSEAETSLPRDAELVLIGREVAGAAGPTIVAGDLNDVAWSHTSRLFRRISRLLDPRIGRGMFNTFHAGLWPLRWPLDHVFVSDDFLLHEIRRLPAFGSDHFPMLIALEYRPAVADLQEAPAADRDDQIEAEDKLERVGLCPAAAG